MVTHGTLPGPRHTPRPARPGAAALACCSMRAEWQPACPGTGASGGGRASSQAAAASHACTTRKRNVQPGTRTRRVHAGASNPRRLCAACPCGLGVVCCGTAAVVSLRRAWSALPSAKYLRTCKRLEGRRPHHSQAEAKMAVARLTKLREILQSRSLAAFVCPTDDAHLVSIAASSYHWVFLGPNRGIQRPRARASPAH